jgi:hypothetical protein
LKPSSQKRCGIICGWIQTWGAETLKFQMIDKTYQPSDVSAHFAGVGNA